MRSFNFSEPWTDISDYPDTHRLAILKELSVELTEKHCLFKRELELIAKREDCDTVLLTDNVNYFIVHLTWSGSKEFYPFPRTQELSSFISVQEILDEDARLF